MYDENPTLNNQSLKSSFIQTQPNLMHQPPNNQINTNTYPTLTQPILQNKLNPYYTNANQSNNSQNISNQYQTQQVQSVVIPNSYPNENLITQNYQNSYQSPPNYHQFQSQPSNFSSNDISNELPNAVMQFV